MDTEKAELLLAGVWQNIEYYFLIFLRKRLE